MDEQTARVWIASIGVAGTLLGTLLGAAGTLLIERARRLREDRFRWAVERRALYVRFLNECEAVMQSTTRVAHSGDRGAPSDAASLYQKADDTYTELTIVASTRVLDAATELIMLTGGLLDQAGPYGERTDWLMNVESPWREQRGAFQKAVRKDLGTDAG